MKKFEYIFSFGGWIGLAACLVFIVFLDRCQDRPASEPKLIEKETIVIYDSTIRILPVTLPVSTSTTFIGIPAIVDTAAILKAYYSIFTYSDQIQDSSIRIQIFDTISQNKIASRQTKYEWLKPIKTTESFTVHVTNNNSGLYLGAFAIGKKNSLGAGPSLTLLTRNNLMISYGFDVINKQHQVSTHFRINGRIKN